MPADLVLSRRTTVGLAALAALGAVALAGCTDTPSPPAGRAPTAPDPDADVMAEAVAQTDAALDLVRRTARSHPALAGRLRPLQAMHRSHARVLGGGSSTASAGATASGGPAVPQQTDRALAAVRTHERSLQAELASLAGRADSGGLARVLASMSAGVAQRVAVLTDPSGGDGA